VEPTKFVSCSIFALAFTRATSMLVSLLTWQDGVSQRYHSWERPPWAGNSRLEWLPS